MPAPTNISFATATDLGTTLPVTVTQRVDDSGTTYTVYYSYTAQASDPPVIGIFGFGDLSVYTPGLSVYIGPVGSPTLFIGATVNKPIQMLVTPGTTYFFKIQPFGMLNPTPANLTLNVQRFPQSAGFPIGSIAVNDDSEGFPIAVLDAATAAPLYFVSDNSASEAAAVTTSGTVAIGNDSGTAPNEVRIYNAALQRIATITLPHHVRCITSNMSNRFYMNEFGTGHIWAYDVHGNFVNLWTVPDTDNVSLAVTHGDTVLYYASLGVNTPIKRFDLVNNVALTNLAAGRATYTIERSSMLCLSDGSIIAAYYGGSGNDVSVRRYDSTGTILNTYAMGNSNADVRLAMAIDDPVSFWIWTKDVSGGFSTGVSTFRNVQASNGAILKTVSAVEFETGVYVPAATATPARFGHSESCDFWITRNVAPPAVHTSTQITRRQRTAPHLSNEQQWLFYSQFQLDLQTGQGAITGQGQSPQIMLEWSDDGGHTWSNEHWVMASQLGQYKARAIWRRLGRSRDRIFRVTVSDPVAWNLIAAFLQAEPGTS